MMSEDSVQVVFEGIRAKIAGTFLLRSLETLDVEIQERESRNSKKYFDQMFKLITKQTKYVAGEMTIY